MAPVLLAVGARKFIAAAAARAFRLSWHDSARLGALFDTRGLLMLVVGLIGLQLKIISSLTFGQASLSRRAALS